MLVLATLAHAAPLDAADLRQHAGLMALVDRVDELRCATPLVLSLEEHWAHLPAADRAHATAVLAPFKADLFDPLPVNRAAGAPPPASDTCWGQMADNRIVGDHFVVEYDDGVDADDADAFLTALEYSWEKEVNDLGWNEPDGSDQYLMLAYVQNQNTGGAYTTVERCGNVYMPYIVTGKDSWRDPYWGDTMAAHEFNHAIQYSYGYSPEFWWWEATATYIEDYVYPNVNYWSAYVTGYTDHPEIAFAAYSQQDYDVFYHMYGMAIWAFYIDNYHGGHDTVQETWKNASRESGTYTYGGNDMVDDLGLDWDESYLDFTARNTVMDYEQQRFFSDIELVDTIRSLPYSAESGRDAPQGYGQNYYKVAADAGGGDLVVSFTTEERVDFAVQIVEADDAVLRHEYAVVEDAGEVRLEDFGDHDAWIIISPLKYTDNDTEYAYAFTARLDEGEVDPPDTDGDDTGDGLVDQGDGDTDGDVSITGPACACNTGGQALPALGMAATVLALARRRR
ncbi:MAG: hypothetical protein FJ090_02750 [Deltaproteobacteria bacterium]|nr:hypothetical protein [Deltaproteobacteria bacterium]